MKNTFNFITASFFGFIFLMFYLFLGQAGAVREITAVNVKRALNHEAHIRVHKKKNTACRLPKDIIYNKVINNETSFKEWVLSFSIEAELNGISHATIAEAFEKIHPVEKVIDLDKGQKEYSLTFFQYLNKSISSRRVNRGKSMLLKYPSRLKELEKMYGVPPQILIALWAIESDFGENMGDYPAIATLATLGHEGRRSAFFKNELLCALSILDDGHITVDKMKSSWAGAMGQPQFMPSTFFYYAVDGSGDGKKDIWRNHVDVLTSEANYLNKIGWQPGHPWGFEVKLPEKFDPYQARLEVKKSVQDWKKAGINKADGNKIPNYDFSGSIILPSGIHGPAFLVFHNFEIIREWNKSMYYALTVGHLSDRINGGSALVGKVPAGEKPLSRKQTTQLQKDLQQLGFYQDKIDGMIGLESGNAIREYQKYKNIPADGYPSLDVISQIKHDVMFLEKK